MRLEIICRQIREPLSTFSSLYFLIAIRVGQASSARTEGDQLRHPTPSFVYQECPRSANFAMLVNSWNHLDIIGVARGHRDFLVVFQVCGFSIVYSFSDTRMHT